MPEEWLKEMGCRPESEGGKAAPENAEGAGNSAEVRSSTPKSVPRERPQANLKTNEVGGNDMMKSIFSALLAAVITGLAYYYYRGRMTIKPASKGLLALVKVEGSIMDVYDYISTADFRTEWHLGCVEVSGPAIDHSAIPGEVFVEELSIGSREVLIEWNVLERQIPSSVSSHHAEFAVEGLAKVQGRPSETWKETIRLRGGQHQYAKTSHVEVEVELDIGVKKGDERGKPWRRQVSRVLKDSLGLLRDRIRERVHKKAGAPQSA